MSGTVHAPLRADELSEAVALMRRAGHARGPTIVSVSLLEARGPVRHVRVVWVDQLDGRTQEGDVDLTRAEVLDVRRVEAGHAAFLPAEVALVGTLLGEHPDYVTALARRKLRPEDVDVGLFPAGNRELPTAAHGRRVFRTSCWLRRGRRPYTAPVEGIVAIVDVVAPAVLEVRDAGVTPLPPASPDLVVDRPRTDLRPLAITQPEGPSFTLDGWTLRWQRFGLRLGFTAREGLVLHDVAYRDGDEDRSILRRASLSEMVVPYADSGFGHHDRAVFDVGEGMLGLFANSLRLGCDCLGEIRYLDAVVNDHDGGARTIEHAICIHEEDDGVLWKHTDASGHPEVRRSRKLVISWFATLDNYDYGFYWSLRQDGSIEMEVKLTGIVLVQAVAPGAVPVHGELVAPQLNGLAHQHFFCFRLHMAVDDGPNTICEQQAQALELGAGNPHANAFTTSTRPLRREREAIRDADPAAARTWTVASRDRRNALGQPTAYTLMPGEHVRPLAHPQSSFRRRAGFAAHALWVTPFVPDELFAAGDYPNLHPGGAGLPEWTAADRSLEDGELVLWHTVGVHHVPRPEDWPVMPVVRTSFLLRPSGFFDRNPALDVAPPVAAAGRACCA